MPLASVIIPTYNRLALLREAIASVLRQTMPDFEILAIDDGSTDGTTEAALGAIDSRIRYIRVPHGGRSKARNLGLREAKGRFVAFLDDDDLYLPDKLESEIGFFRRHPDLDLAASGATIATMETGEEFPSQPWLDQPAPDLFYILRQCRFLMCSVAIRRAFLQKTHVAFDETLHSAEDFDFYARLSMAGCRMGWLEKIVARYRVSRAASRAPAVGHAMACIDVAARLLAHPGIPEAIARRKNEILAERHLFCGFRAMAGGLDRLAARCLQKACNLNPELVGEGRRALFERLDAFVGDEIGGAAPGFAEAARAKLSDMGACKPALS